MTQPMQDQLYTQNELFEPSTYLNQGDPGFFSLLVKQPDGNTRQTSYRLDMLTRILQYVDPAYDTWISQASFFRPNRRAVNLRALGLLFSDLDIYHSPGLAGRSIDEVVSLLLTFCDLEGIPWPSIVLFSGRGLQAKWILEIPILRASILRWNDVQKALCAILDNFGSDPKARDCSRVLRLEHTVNTKTGETVKVVHVTGSNSAPTKYDFDTLAGRILERVPQPPLRSPIQKEKDISVSRAPIGRVETLDWARLEDIRTLWAIRGGCREGYRETTLFWMVNFLFRASPVPMSQFWNEAQALASEIYPGSWYKESNLTTVYTKALQYRAGDRVIYQGRSYPPLYTPRNDTLAEVFRITAEEERSLKTIISQVEKDRRRAEKRRAEGIPERNRWVDTRPWEAFGISRATWYRKGCPKP